MENKNNSGIKILLERIVKYSAVLTVVCYLVTLFGGFDVKTLLGFLAGYVYECVCIVYLGHTCENVVCFEKEKAKKSMYLCYTVRYSGLFLLCAAAMLTGWVNFVGILLPQFFPRIILSIIQFFDRKGG